MNQLYNYSGLLICVYLKKKVSRGENQIYITFVDYGSIYVSVIGYDLKIKDYKTCSLKHT